MIAARLLSAQLQTWLTARLPESSIGILARAAMTVLTLAGGMSFEFRPLTFTVPGTITIVTLAMLGGIPIALLLVIF